MKPEFSEVLIPASKLHTSASSDSSIRLIGREKTKSGMDKCFVTGAIIFAFILGIVTTGFIVRYEDKLGDYEGRIATLEKELSGIYGLWEEEYGPLHVSEKDFEYEIPAHPNLYGSGSEEEPSSDDYASKEEEKKEEKEHEHGKQEVKMDMTRTRRKRQIPIQDIPTFGPEVQRTADGVPILENSYLDRGDQPLRPAAAFFQRFEQPPAVTESEGLRLYEGLLATGGRNEPRSLDHISNGFGSNGILPHHRSSAAWSEKEERRHHSSRSSSSIQLKSGDSQPALPTSGFGEHTGPNFSEEVTYRRSAAGRRQSNGNGGVTGMRRYTRNCATTTTTVNEDGTTSTQNTGARRCATGANGGSQSSSTSAANTGARSSQTRSSNSASSTRSLQSSSSSQANNNLQSSSSSLANNGYTCVTCTRSNSGISSDNPSRTVTYHRRSRVPSSDFIIPSNPDINSHLRSLTYPPLQRLGQGDGEVIARVLQSDHENEELSQSGHGLTSSASEASAAEQHSESRTQGSRRVTPKRQAAQAAYRQGRKSQYHSNQRRQQHEGGSNLNIVRAEAWVESPGKPVAAHYVADVSNYTTSHRHYEGNGRLRNADGIFAAWKPSDWMESSGSSDGENKNFVLNQNGVLTIKKPGLYYIYAQIHYLDEHDINGYVVQVNTTPFLQCTTMTETHNGGSKSNSCFTAGITQLKENDRILVKDIETNRYSIFKPEKSFFGLMKIGDTH